MNKRKLIISALALLILAATISVLWFNLSKSNSKKLSDSALSSPQDLEVPALGYDDSSIILIWHKPDNYKDITDYNIYKDGKRIGDANNNSASISKAFIDNFYKDASNSSAVKVSAHTYTVTGLKPDTSYSFSVRSVDSKGNESVDSIKIEQRTAKANQIFDVTKYGAVGDGKNLDTKSIQAAIDACTPGGEVLIPSGKTFKSGSIWLKTDMIFKVDGILLGSENPQDYLISQNGSKSSKSNSLVNASEGGSGKNLKIIGKGTIDGNGWKQDKADAVTGFPNSLKSSISSVANNGILAANQFKLGKSNGLSDVDAYATRSNLISISHIDNVYYGDGLSLVNPAQHVIGSSDCSNVVLNSIQIKTFDCNNGDGIDFDSHGLIVLNSVFDTGDDCVNFTAGKGADAEKNRKPVDNVWIFDNYFGRGHGAVVAGSNTAAWIQNILSEDNVLNGTGSGLRCKTSPQTGGGARNITFRDSALKNITDGEGEPFIFTSAYSNTTAVGSFVPAEHLPQFKHIFVSNCSVDGTKGNSIFVSGLAGSMHDDINFENVSFKNSKPAKINYMSNSTFNNVTFDSSIQNPWDVVNSVNLHFDNK